MSESLMIVTRAQLLHRIKAEYIEMPGLRLTVAQAGRLWGLDTPACLDLLGAPDQRAFSAAPAGRHLFTRDRRPARADAAAHDQGRVTGSCLGRAHDLLPR